MPLLLDIKTPARSLNKAYLKETAGRSSIEKCKQQLLHLLEKADPASRYTPKHAIIIDRLALDLYELMEVEKTLVRKA